MSEEVVERSSRCRLINELERLQGEDVIIRLVGGFQADFGRLVRIEDCLATGTEVDLQLPGGGFLELGNLTVNLCAINSVSVDNR